MPFTSNLSTGRWARPSQDTAVPRGRYYRGGDTVDGYTDRNNQGGDDDEEAVTVMKKLITVERVDFKEFLNAFDSHTYMYERIRPFRGTGCNVVMRRGENLRFDINFDRPYDEKKDLVSVVFETGDRPREGDGSRVVLPLYKKSANDEWGISVYNAYANNVNVTVKTPATCPIGKWKFRINVINGDNKAPVIKEWVYSKDIYMLFNPWCKDDTVYHPRDDFRDKYVLEEDGGIFRGSNKNFSVKKWSFGQFEDPVLDCTLWLLRDLRPSSRADPVLVTRQLSAAVNSFDNGVLVGNWSGNYEGGIKPTSWNGSVGILEQHYKTKSPVKFGQCWVFSGVLTTCLRTLGIPARSVTNFSSAHDTDNSCTIDKYYKFSDEGKVEPDDMRNQDSIWNFHVWNDAWMSRPDLLGDFKQSGWQACDATPQEASIDGVLCCGPTPVKAIRNGNVEVAYDTPFVFAEVNGDIVYWVQDSWSDEYEIYNVNNKGVGKRILTYVDGKVEDITEEYKSSDEKESREALQKALSVNPRSKKSRSKTALLDYYDIDKKLQPEVKMELVDIDSVLYGDPYTVSVKVYNLTDKERTLTIDLSSKSYYYTGQCFRHVKSQKFADDKLSPREEKVYKMTVTCEEYEPAVCENCFFKIFMRSTVKETKRTYLDSDDFNLQKPEITVRATRDKVKVGENVLVKVSFVNSLPLTLTECVLSVEGIGLQRPRAIPMAKFVKPKETFVYEFDICPFKARKDKKPRTLIVDFDSKQMIDIKGSCEITVVEE